LTFDRSRKWPCCQDVTRKFPGQANREFSRVEQ
jgi:hypothetical protein